MDKKIAIIGTGPSGMAAAQILAQDGFDVTMYEKADRPGGILMYGIPHIRQILSYKKLQQANQLLESSIVFHHFLF